MEEPTKYTRKIAQEPGRRYAAGRVKPRAGADIRPHNHHTPQSKVDQVGPKEPTVRRNPTVKPALPRTKRSQVLRRQMVERAEEQRFKIKKTRSKHFLWYGLALLTLGALCTVLWSFKDVLPFHVELFKPEPKIVNSVDSDPEETSSLDEAAVSEVEVGANVVAADSPKTIRIAKLSILARVRQVGTTLSNEPIAPKNIHDVGWYEGSSKPGGEGAVLLNGHLAGPTKAGVFSEINMLAAGDQIVLERGDGQAFTYVVERTQEYGGGQIDMIAATNSIDPAKKGLNLVTTLNKYSGTEKRIMVFAVEKKKN